MPQKSGFVPTFCRRARDSYAIRPLKMFGHIFLIWEVKIVNIVFTCIRWMLRSKSSSVMCLCGSGSHCCYCDVSSSSYSVMCLAFDGCSLSWRCWTYLITFVLLSGRASHFIKVLGSRHPPNMLVLQIEWTPSNAKPPRCVIQNMALQLRSSIVRSETKTTQDHSSTSKPQVC